MSDKTALTIRIDKDLADEFKRVCDEKDYSQSFVIRELMKKWLSDNKQRDLFKQVFGSIGVSRATQKFLHVDSFDDRNNFEKKGFKNL